jgi:hypothetical protein
MSTGPYVSVELEAATADRARLVLAGPGGGPAAPIGPGLVCSYALVDLAAEPPGWVALATVTAADSDEPTLVELLVDFRFAARGHERDLLDAVTDRMRAGGARRLRIGPDVGLEL